MKRWLAGTVATALEVAVIAAPATAQTTASVAITADRPGPTYDRRIFTQFAEHLGNGIYGGLSVGAKSSIPHPRGFRNGVVGALRQLGEPTIRWPGGCSTDECHWREGIGPRAGRPVRIHTHCGGVSEPDAVGTHEFMGLAEQIGAEPYIAGNVGDGALREMAEWIAYMTSPAGSLADECRRNDHLAPWKVPLFGIGNETRGCGGNIRAEYAADVTRRYATFVKAPTNTRIFATPDLVKPTPFATARLAGGALTAILPAKSSIMLDLQ